MIFLGSKAYCNPEIQFTCSTTGICLRKYRYCDGIRDCEDGSDEKLCPAKSCKITDFKCGDGSCVDQTKRCDFYKDCANNADENDCGRFFSNEENLK